MVDIWFVCMIVTKDQDVDFEEIRGSFEISFVGEFKNCKSVCGASDGIFLFYFHKLFFVELFFFFKIWFFENII